MRLDVPGTFQNNSLGQKEVVLSAGNDQNCSKEYELFFYRKLSQAYLQSRTRKSQLCRRCGAFVDGGE